jgi:2-oxoglutarate dehydrogenase E1 component
MTLQAKAGEARTADNEQLLDTAFLYGPNAAYIEQLYAQYVDDPNSVTESWRIFFKQVGDPAEITRKAAEGPEWRNPAWPKPANSELISALDGDWHDKERSIRSKIEARAQVAASPTGLPSARPTAADISQQVRDSIRALMLIRAYRIRGHLAAHLDPLGMEKREEQPELDPASYGFGPEDMDRRIYIDNVLGLDYATPRQMVDILRRTYCGNFAVEFMHISDPKEKAWIQGRIEGADKEIAFTPEGKRAILSKLVETETFERFLHKRFPGTKRFGLDGGEAMVPAMEQIIKRGGNLGVDEIILGMPHRGRLNVLAGVLSKPYHKIFHEFQGGSTQGDDYGSGDVKYHLGASSDRVFDNHSVHLSLTANPPTSRR